MSGPTAQRIAIAAAAVLWLVGAAACDTEIDVHNSVPRVTWAWVGAPDPATGVSEVVIWVDDLEGDPVDLGVTIVAGGGPSSFELAPGGHGLVGLTTRGALFDPNGQPHTILWDTQAVTADTVTLRFVPDDLRGGVGDAKVTPSFSLADGTGEVVALEPAP